MATPSTPLKNESAAEVVAGISTAVVETLSAIASVAGPMAAPCTISLAILNTVSKVRENKEAFAELARDACELVYAAIHRSQDATGPSAELPKWQLQQDVGRLVAVLEEIKKFSERRASRCIVCRLALVSVDAGRIEKYRGRLIHTLHVFYVESSVSIRDTVNQILAEVQEAKRAVPQGTSAAGTTSSPSPPPQVEYRGNFNARNINTNVAAGDMVQTYNNANW